MGIQQSFPHSSLILLSPLAEGADRLAARVALQLGISLVVPLPMSQQLYEQDFETAESRAEFVDLLGHARARIDLPLLVGATEASVRSPGRDRDREYAKVGAYIASHSQIFFALWDGLTDGDEEKVGGTAQIVRFRLEGVPAPYDSPQGALTLTTAVGPVCGIVTPRQSHSSVLPAALTQRILVPDHRTAESFHRLCERMDLFNADAQDLRAELGQRADESKARLLNTDVRSTPNTLKALPISCERILDQYAVADGLAIHFGGKTLKASRGVLVGVAAAAIFFNTHSSFFSIPNGGPAALVDRFLALPWYLICFLACSTFTAVWLYGRAERGEYQNKYQDYRALAEALRIQFYWRVAGVPESVVDTYLRKQRSELEWIRSALRSWAVLTTIEGSAGRPAEVPRSRGLPLVTHWIQDQRRYFASKARLEKQKLDNETTIVAGLLKLSGGLSVALALALSIPLISALAPVNALQRLIPTPFQHATLMVLIPMLAVSAGLLHGYGQLLARSEHIRQFGRMGELFDAGARELERLLREHNQEAVTALVRELGVEALEENGDWLILHRERPLEVPPG